MNTVKLAIFPLVLSAAVATAQADNYEGYTSLVEGVGLWWLETSEYGVSRQLTLGENPDFVTYCDGKNKIHIYEENSRAVMCNTDYWLFWDDVSQSAKEYRHLDKKALQHSLKKATRGDNADYYRFMVSAPDLRIRKSGIYTVSKTKLVRGDWTVSVPSSEEREASITLAKRHLLAIPRDDSANEYRLAFGMRDEEIDQITERAGNEPAIPIAINRRADTRPAVSYTTKIETKDVQIILIPTLYESGGIDGDLFSSVILKRQREYSFLGHVKGCLLSVGADIDRDGVPEIIMESCNNYEGHSIHYYKIFPETKPLITYAHY